MDGMFVEAAPDRLDAAKLVWVQFPADVGLRCLKAMVVHSSEQGVGLMFCAFENEERHLLARFLSEGHQWREE